MGLTTPAGILRRAPLTCRRACRSGFCIDPHKIPRYTMAGHPMDSGQRDYGSPGTRINGALYWQEAKGPHLLGVRPTFARLYRRPRTWAHQSIGMYLSLKHLRHFCIAHVMPARNPFILLAPVTTAETRTLHFSYITRTFPPNGWGRLEYPSLSITVKGKESTETTK